MFSRRTIQTDDRRDFIGPSRSSPSCSLVFSVTSESKPTTDEDSLVPHGIFSRRDRPKKDRNPRLASPPSVLMETPPSSLVSSVRRVSWSCLRLLRHLLSNPLEEGPKPTTIDESLSPHRLSTFDSRLLRVKNDANPPQSTASLPSVSMPSVW
ncbi:hypothetical protein Bca52824_076908 [Brassica carinata]|uniref:Uncharacterized protein n=1 Tax=Brassica carinata TaxID=52824 RepID=A0A8X7PSK1_BRACI|nr:hypothetical protein Bca52824_076908 [Brassica carinata]